MPARKRPIAPFEPEAWAAAIALAPLVRAVARRFLGRGLGLDDLVQEGLLGACRAWQTHDPKLGPWPGYAAGWARHAIQEAIRDGALVRRTARASRDAAAQQSCPLDLVGHDLPDREPRGDPDSRLDALAAVAALPATRRAAVRLRFGLDPDGPGPLTLHEVGAALGMSHKGAAYHLDAALATLRRDLAVDD